MKTRIIGVNGSISGSRILPYNCIPGAKGSLSVVAAYLLGRTDIAARDEEKERLDSSILHLITPMRSSLPNIESFRA